jgi:hypothetical protein
MRVSRWDDQRAGVVEMEIVIGATNTLRAGSEPRVSV